VEGVHGGRHRIIVFCRYGEEAEENDYDAQRTETGVRRWTLSAGPATGQSCAHYSEVAGS
jgi:hypothetical protein